jgi:hypothetical protein
MFVHVRHYSFIRRSQSMKRNLALTAVLAVALAVTGYAQKKDFSGTWTMDQEATAAANPAATGGGGGGGGMRGGGGGPITIKHTADSLTIERQGQQGTMSTVYKLDGSEVEVPAGRGGTAKAKAKMEGDKIVIEQTRQGQDGTPTTSTITYSLDDKGMLWMETKTANGSRKVAYKKTT